MPAGEYTALVLETWPGSKPFRTWLSHDLGAVLMETAELVDVR